MDQVSQIREKIDVVALISEFVTLKKVGRNFSGLCPFHNEKTPSFVVSPERQIWHCFGCQKGGDVFTFLMEYETIEFSESLKILAKKAGIELITRDYDGGLSSKKDMLYTINHLAGEFYHYILLNHAAGKKALSYLMEKRGLTIPLIKTFTIGFAPGSGNALSQYLLQKKKYKQEDVLAAGVSFLRGREARDFFRNRILFPLIDHRGNVVGFSGRTMDDNFKTGPKYINTKDTLIYHKGGHFFGIHSAKEEIKKTGRALIVEGEFDVISCFSQGFKNVVAVKGTALTEQQVAILSRFTQKVTLCFDMDSPGQEAIKRSVPILENKGITTTIVEIANGKDADEAIKENPYAFKQAVKHDIPVYDFLLKEAVLKYDKKTAEGKKKIAEVVLPLISLIQNEIVKEHHIRKVSQELATSYESTLKEIERIGKPHVNESAQQVISAKTKRERNEVLEEYLLALIIQYAHDREDFEAILKIVGDFTFEYVVYQKIFDRFIDFISQKTIHTLTDFSKTLPKELVTAFDTCYLFSLPDFSNQLLHQKEIEKIAYEIQGLRIRKQMKEVSEKIKTTSEDDEEYKTLSAKLASLVTLLRKPS